MGFIVACIVVWGVVSFYVVHGMLIDSNAFKESNLGLHSQVRRPAVVYLSWPKLATNRLCTHLYCYIISMNIGVTKTST